MVGDSLVERIQHGIKNTDYFAVVLSKSAVESTWVKREVEAALATEIAADRVTILPILYKKCDVPQFLRAKIYVDFRAKKRYDEGIRLLLRRLRPQAQQPKSFFFSKWTPELARVGVLLRILETREGEIVIADRVFATWAKKAREWISGDMKRESPGAMLLTAMLEVVTTANTPPIVVNAVEIQRLHHEMQMQLLDIMTSEAIRIGLLTRSEETLALSREVIPSLLRMTMDFVGPLTSSQLDIERLWIGALGHEVRTRLSVHKSAWDHLANNLTEFIFTMIIRDKEPFLDVKRKVEEVANAKDNQ